jgi:hypothetical protein
MSASWTWTYLDADGATLTGGDLPTGAFPSQGEAESWLGEEWHRLAAQGVEAVTLLEGDTEVYGPMSLRPSE